MGDPESVFLKEEESLQAFQASLLSPVPYITVKQHLQNTGLHQNLQGSLQQIAGPPRISVGLGWVPRICFSYIPSDASTAGVRTTL